LAVERGNAGLGQGSSACAVVRGVQLQQFPDLFEREAGLLR
jgi:hypothetical protein